MSHIEKITGELRTMIAGVDKAHANAVAADGKAQEVAARAARSGFTGIAAGMTRVRDAIAEIRARLTNMSGSINEAVTAVGAAAGELSPEQTIAVLSPAQEKLSSVHSGLAATITKVEETRRLVAVVLQGGQPGPMLSALENIKQILVLVAQRGDTARQHLETAVGEARQVGESGN
jgi:hypothetical protein